MIERDGCLQVIRKAKSAISEFYSDPTASHPAVIELQAALQVKKPSIVFMPQQSTAQCKFPSFTRTQTLVFQEVYPELNELSTRSPDGFQPHLTLGQDSRGRLLTEVRGFPLSFSRLQVRLQSVWIRRSFVTSL